MSPRFVQQLMKMVSTLVVGWLTNCEWNRPTTGHIPLHNRTQNYRWWAFHFLLRRHWCTYRRVIPSNINIPPKPITHVLTSSSLPKARRLSQRRPLKQRPKKGASGVPKSDARGRNHTDEAPPSKQQYHKPPSTKPKILCSIRENQ